MQGTERHLFPVVLREYHNPDHKDLHPRLIEFLSTYPAMQSNVPEGVFTTRPDLHKIEEGPVQELRQFFWDCLAEYRYNYKFYCYGFELGLIWANFAPAGSGFGDALFRHPVASFSAVGYITDGEPA